MTYLITFTCYGAHLHGHEAGSVDRTHNITGSRILESNPDRFEREMHRMEQPPYTMDHAQRQIVLSSILDRSSQNKWNLLAAHIRTNHVHIVVEADIHPDRIMNDLKSYASRCLNQRGHDDPNRKRWARHGSTRWLWQPENVASAIRYVVEGQGEAMAVFEAVVDRTTASFGRGSDT